MRQRGTAIVIRDNKVLLVRDAKAHRYSLPGGGINKNEPVVSAAAREVYEELGLHVTMVKRIQECDFRGSLSEHRVCLVEVTGEPNIRSHELDKFIWWDMKEEIPVFEHVTYILNKAVKLID
jgi:ADP-ribose pyrophosphatase YjhB (NUDIX family)